MNTKRHANCQLRNDWKERIIRIGDEQTSLQNQFDNLRNDFSDNSPRIEALETNVNALDGRVIIAESDIAAAENRISACENDIDRIDAELVDKTGDINALANRMTLAEADIDSIDARVSGIETGEILLSQLVVDADKNMAGKTLNNVKINANEVSVRGSQIEPTRINNDIVLFDIQPDIDAESCPHTLNPPVYLANTDPELPFSKYIYAEGQCWLYRAPQPANSVLPFVPIKRGNKIYVEYWLKSEDGVLDNVYTIVYYYDGSKNYIKQAGTERQGSSIWEKRQLVYTPPENARYIKVTCLLNNSQAAGKVSMSGLKFYTDANFDSDLSAKNISADAVIIKDGGTVDGVDVSAHTHDGTAEGGARISADKIDGTKRTRLTGLLNGDVFLPVGTIALSASHKIVNDTSTYSGKRADTWTPDWGCQFLLNYLHAPGIKYRVSARIKKTGSPGTIVVGYYNGGSPTNAVITDKVTTDWGVVDLFTISPSFSEIGANYIYFACTAGIEDTNYISIDWIKLTPIYPSISIDGATITATKTAGWDGKADGSIFTPAKAAEWDGKAKPPAYKQYYNDNLTNPTTEYLEPSAGRTAFIPMQVNASTIDGEIKIYAIFDDSSELLLLHVGGSASSTTAFKAAHEITQILGAGNKSGRTITRFKIEQYMEAQGTAGIHTYEF